GVSPADQPGGEPALEDARAFAGVPDDTQRLWTPHRMAYIGGGNKPEDPHDDEQCPFCAGPRRRDEDALIVHRGRVAYAIRNGYTCDSGRLRVCPCRHVSDDTELTEEEVAEVAEITRTAMTVIRAVSGAAGFNLGMNQGEVAGAGIAAHLHQHVVPRWRGDANFLPIIGRTKALPILLADTRRALAAAWPGPAAPVAIGRASWRERRLSSSTE